MGNPTDDLMSLLREARESIGWRGDGPRARDQYYCEHCGETHVDYRLIRHQPDCLAARIDAAIAPCDPIGDALRAMPILGTLNIDDPHDPRNKELKL